MTINIEKANRYFDTSRSKSTALFDFDLKIQTGEFLCLLGPSGCGKSTLLNLIAGLDSPNSGQLLANETIISGPDPQRMLMFQEAALFPWLNVQDNVSLGLKARGLPKNIIKAKVQHYLAMVGLQNHERAWIHELSGGMRQRVALARALVMEPAVLLMDEPFAALDAMTRDGLHVELQNLWAQTKCTVIFVTHNVREALILGDRVILMAAKPGRIYREYQITLQRPRHFEDPGIVEQARIVLADLASIPNEDNQL